MADAEFVYVSLNFGQPRQEPETPLTDEQVEHHLVVARSVQRRAETMVVIALEGGRVWHDA